MHLSTFQLFVFSGFLVVALSILPKSIRSIFSSIIAGLGAIFVLSAIVLIAGR